MGDRQRDQLTVVRAAAPVRIDFAGGWSDVPEFANREGGVVVNAAIVPGAEVECVMGGDRIRLHADDLGEHVTVGSATAIRYDGKLDLHKAALNMLPVGGGIEIISRSGVPPGSGLGASASLDVALVAALARCREDLEYDPVDLAELGFHLEAEELGLAGGRQDQYAAALGGFLRLRFGTAGVEVQRLGVSAEHAEDLARHIVLVYTGQTHFSSATHTRVWNAYRSGDATVAAAIGAMRDIADDAAAVLEAGDWPALAALVDRNWREQQRLDPTIWTARTRRIEHAARQAGAWGVKATGAGAGGCVVILAPADVCAAVSRVCEEEGGRVLDWSWDMNGVRTW